MSDSATNGDYGGIDLDEEERRLEPYRNSDGRMTTPAASRARTLEIIAYARHLRRYAEDAERGNGLLRDALSTLITAVRMHNGIGHPSDHRWPEEKAASELIGYRWVRNDEEAEDG